MYRRMLFNCGGTRFYQCAGFALWGERVVTILFAFGGEMCCVVTVGRNKRRPLIMGFGCDMRTTTTKKKDHRTFVVSLKLFWIVRYINNDD